MMNLFWKINGINLFSLLLFLFLFIRTNLLKINFVFVGRLKCRLSLHPGMTQMYQNLKETNEAPPSWYSQKASPIGVRPIETRGERGKRSGKVWLRRLSLGSLWFLIGLVNPKRLKPNLGFRVSWWTVGVISTENLIHQSWITKKRLAIL